MHSDCVLHSNIFAALSRVPNRTEPLGLSGPAPKQPNAKLISHHTSHAVTCAYIYCNIHTALYTQAEYSYTCTRCAVERELRPGRPLLSRLYYTCMNIYCTCTVYARVQLFSGAVRTSCVSLFARLD